MTDSNEGESALLDPFSAELLGEALSPIAPAPERAAAMRARIMGKVQAHRSIERASLLTMQFDDGQWERLSPLVEVKRLFKSPVGHGFLFRLQPGGAIPAHDHPDDEECIVLEGEVHLGEIVVKAGGFHLAPRGVRHEKLRAPKGALFYLRTGPTAPI